ncbi:MAG: nucleotidyl transferase AbiEii/AbiGii toxin family protein [Coriobacteriales bacterium]|jgi:predicted nucleotidyltransferase component of viral defense system|nr:nucleotidyl transferase AbiEii/AbiGii toxin family protein [Coriobacteriales bacterium]
MVSTRLYDDMLADYDLSTRDAKQAATREVMQRFALAGLHAGGFFGQAAFYGGTALRLLYGLDRTSEDMDFSLLSPQEGFTLEPYFAPLIDEFALAGHEVTISEKKKSHATAIDSAFLKDNTRQYDVIGNLLPTIRIKIEVDTLPPPLFETEYRLSMKPYSFMVRCYTLPSSFAGKMSAVLYRAWLNRVKGRDWYDFEWYVRNGIAMDLRHVSARARQITGRADELDEGGFRKLLADKIASTDFAKARRDVTPFITDVSRLEIWSTEYFHMVAEQMRIQEH